MSEQRESESGLKAELENMEFIRWWKSKYPTTVDEATFILLREAWDTATRAERETCAGICDRFAERNMHPAECAGAIRIRSN